MDRIGTSRITHPGLRTRDLSSTATLEATLPPWAESAPALRASFLTEPARPQLFWPSEGPPHLAADATRAPAGPRPLRVHFFTMAPGGTGRAPRTVELPAAAIDAVTRRVLGHFMLETAGGTNLFLTLPDRSNGLLLPSDTALRSYTTLPLELASERLVLYRSTELLRTVVAAHRVAQRELEEIRDRVGMVSESWVRDALFAPPQLPEVALFDSPRNGELWRRLQGLHEGERLAYTPEVPGLVRRWWQVGSTELLRATADTLPSPLLDTTLGNLRRRFEAAPGTLLALHRVEDLLRHLSLEEVERFVQGARETAEERQGKIWISWSPGSLSEVAERSIGRGFGRVLSGPVLPWTLSGVGEDARLVPFAHSEADGRRTEGPSVEGRRLTLQTWLSGSVDGGEVEAPSVVLARPGAHAASVGGRAGVPA